ncbi:high-potential iron-sulfur protein [Spirosoma sp. SC4-14]|uniref:high-potential iron-sulfur protein n=1 Tax=Spirosoma sp. SC4-14 TaxID=3128900 RepID=UPI0030CACFEC
MNPSYSRRKFMAVGTSVFGLSLLLSRCRSKSSSDAKESATAIDPCTDFSGVSETDLKTRKKLGYVDQSPRPESKCGNCNLWLPPKAGKACGGCMLFKGPVHTTGYCTYWAPQSN